MKSQEFESQKIHVPVLGIIRKKKPPALNTNYKVFAYLQNACSIK